MKVRLIVLQIVIVTIAATIPSWLTAQENSQPKNAARTFLWEDGAPIIDVESLVFGGSSLRLVTPETDSPRGRKCVHKKLRILQCPVRMRTKCVRMRNVRSLPRRAETSDL
jgi:hypothetical protein